MDRRLKERLIGAAILVTLIVIIVPELLSGPKRSPSQAKPLLPLNGNGAAEPVRNVTVDLATSKALQGGEDPAAASAAGASANEAATSPAETAAGAAGAAGGDADSADADEAGAKEASPAPAPATAPEPPPARLAASRAAAPHATAPHPAAAVAPPPRSPTADAAGRRATRIAAASIPAAPTAPLAVGATPREAESGESPRHAWTVQVGSFATHANADKLARHLRSEGYAVAVSSSGTGHALRYRVRTNALPDRAAAEHALAKLKAKGYFASLIPPPA